MNFKQLEPSLFELSTTGRVMFKMEPETEFVNASQSPFTITCFTTADLVSFGKYLLSTEREASLRWESGDSQEDTLPYEERFRLVHDADIANWVEKQQPSQ